MTGTLERLAAMLRQWRPPASDPDPDRDAGVFVRRPAGPPGPVSAISVAEPEPEIAVDVFARQPRA